MLELARSPQDRFRPAVKQGRCAKVRIDIDVE